MTKVLVYSFILCFVISNCATPKMQIKEVEDHFKLLSDREYRKAYDNQSHSGSFSLEQYMTYHENISSGGNKRGMIVEKKEYKVGSIETIGKEHIVHYYIDIQLNLYSEIVYKNLTVRLIKNRWHIDEKLANNVKIDSLMKIALKEMNLDSPYEADKTISKILSIDPYHIDAKRYSKYQKEDISDYVEAQDLMKSYLDSIVFDYNPSEFYDYGEREGIQELVRIDILNLGTKTINDMKLVFKFYDADDNLVKTLEKKLIDKVIQRNYQEAFVGQNEKRSWMFRYYLFDDNYLVDGSSELVKKFDTSKTTVEIVQMAFK